MSNLINTNIDSAISHPQAVLSAASSYRGVGALAALAKLVVSVAQFAISLVAALIMFGSKGSCKYVAHAIHETTLAVQLLIKSFTGHGKEKLDARACNYPPKLSEATFSQRVDHFIVNQ